MAKKSPFYGNKKGYGGDSSEASFRKWQEREKWPIAGERPNKDNKKGKKNN